MKNKKKIIIGLVVIAALIFVAVQPFSIWVSKNNIDFSKQNPQTFRLEIDKEGYFENININVNNIGKQTYMDCGVIKRPILITNTQACINEGYKDFLMQPEKMCSPKQYNDENTIVCFKHASRTPDKITFSSDGNVIDTWTQGQPDVMQLELSEIVNSKCKSQIDAWLGCQRGEDCIGSEMECQIEFTILSSQDYGELSLEVGDYVEKIVDPCLGVSCDSQCMEGNILRTGTCFNGKCNFEEDSCDDKNPLTLNDYCEDKECRHSPEVQCIDDSLCPEGEICVNNECAEEMTAQIPETPSEEEPTTPQEIKERVDQLSSFKYYIIGIVIAVLAVIALVIGTKKK